MKLPSIYKTFRTIGTKFGPFTMRVPYYYDQIEWSLVCNGAGPSGIIGKAVPDYICGTCITELCDNHDFGYYKAGGSARERKLHDLMLLRTWTLFFRAKRDRLIAKTKTHFFYRLFKKQVIENANKDYDEAMMWGWFYYRVIRAKGAKYYAV